MWKLCLCAGLALLAARTSANESLAFQNIAESAGIRFTLANNPTDQKYIIETMPGGIAGFDYNGDGKPDIFFTNGSDLPSFDKTDKKYWNRLFRNDGNLHFTDVTEQAGVAGTGYSMGVAAGDYDNDGYPDLFVTGVDRQILYHNRGDGTFEDVTEAAGVQSKQWSAAAGFFDYDGDGKLDLLVVRYSKTPLANRYCGDRARDIRVYCNPKYFEPLAPLLYRNRGGGRFQDVSKQSGIDRYPARGMSVAFADYDGDGFPDAFITNDNLPNLLLHNRKDGTFEEVGLTAGAALGDRAEPVASMGADFRDYDNDGLPDLSITALAGETFPLFRNMGRGGFSDVTYSSRIGRLTIGHSGWGNGFVDFDNDGWKDLFTSNSHVNDRVEAFESHVYKEANMVLRNYRGKFGEATPASMSGALGAHRGAAFGDFDGDGRMDVVVSVLGAPAELWRNTTSGSANWIAFHLHGARSNRDGIGATIRVGKQWNDMTSAVSYASASLIPVHFGAGALRTIDNVEVRWPTGKLQELRHLAVNRVIDVTEPVD